MSIDRWMDEEDVAHIYNGILLSHKKEWNNAICSNMDGPRDYHTKMTEKDKYQMISLICGNLKKWYKQTIHKHRPYTGLLNKYQKFKITDTIESMYFDHNRIELKTNQKKIFLT